MSNKPDKGKLNGSCNRTACQAPLANEPEHQFMQSPWTSGGRLYYCRRCSWEFDRWDAVDQPPGVRRITREPKVCEVS